MMKAISLWQPWATLIALGEKRIETRGRKINHQGPLAIHAARRWAPDQSTLLQAEPFRSRLAYHGITAGNVVNDLMPRGAIVAVVDLDAVWTVESLVSDEGQWFEHGVERGVNEFEFGNYARGRYGYVLRHIKRLLRPVPCRGMQAMPFTVPPEVEALVREQLRGAA